MKFINIGFGNLVSAERIVSVISPESAPIKRLIQEARDRSVLIDASFGRSTRSVIVTDSGNVIFSSLAPEVISARAEEKEAEERDNG